MYCSLLFALCLQPRSTAEMGVALGVEGVGLHAVVLECIHDASGWRMYPYPFTTCWYHTSRCYTYRLTGVVLLTLLLPRDALSFRISHQEMIKGIRIGGVGSALRFYDTLEIPVIENTADEEDLTDGMAAVNPPVLSHLTLV